MEYSLTFIRGTIVWLLPCLNPYSNGILTDVLRFSPSTQTTLVLILILMEYSLTIASLTTAHQVSCLNPYSNGILTDLPL